MLKRLKIGILALALSISAMLPVIAAIPVNAQVSNEAKQAACEGIGATGGNCDNSSGASVSLLVGNVINILSWIVGIVAVFMLIIGGMKFILSSGDANGIQSARNTIIYALVGVVVAALAQVMVRFVLSWV